MSEDRTWEFRVTHTGGDFTLQARDHAEAARLAAEPERGLRQQDVVGVSGKRSTKFYLKRGGAMYPVSAQVAAMETHMLGQE